jgi:hypothetical protein
MLTGLIRRAIPVSFVHAVRFLVKGRLHATRLIAGFLAL